MLLLVPVASRFFWVPGLWAAPDAFLLFIRRHFLFKPGGTSPLFCTTSPGYPLTSSTVYSPPPRPLPRSTFARPAFNLKKPSKYCNWKCAALSAIVISATLVILLAYFVVCLLVYLFGDGGLTLSPKLECTGTVIARCSLELLGSSDPSTSASRAAGTRVVHHYTWLIFKFC
ncbi:Teneurin-4, partial [Plecturocebus cupreus]